MTDATYTRPSQMSSSETKSGFQQATTVATPIKVKPVDHPRLIDVKVAVMGTLSNTKLVNLDWLICEYKDRVDQKDLPRDKSTLFGLIEISKATSTDHAWALVTTISQNRTGVNAYHQTYGDIVTQWAHELLKYREQKQGDQVSSVLEPEWNKFLTQVQNLRKQMEGMRSKSGDETIEEIAADLITESFTRPKIQEARSKWIKTFFSN